MEYLYKALKREIGAVEAEPWSVAVLDEQRSEPVVAAPTATVACVDGFAIVREPPLFVTVIALDGLLIDWPPPVAEIVTAVVGGDSAGPLTVISRSSKFDRPPAWSCANVAPLGLR